MRADFLVTAVLAGSLVAAATARADEAGAEHDKRTDVTLSDLSPEHRKATLEAWNHVVCDCPRENWARTLSNCPDGCAVPQKQEVIQRVREGWSLDAIVEEQVKVHGAKAAADPGTALNGTLLVLAGVVIGGAAAGIVLARWKRDAERHRAAAADLRRDEPVAAEESDAVERELREIE